MYRLTLICVIFASTCLAQIPLNPNRPTATPLPTGNVTTSVRDRQEWLGPLVAITGDGRFCRTVSIGDLPTPPALANFDPNAILIGFEISSVQNILSSIQPYYLSNGRRVSGPLVGTIRGARAQVIAREGYAVREVRFSAQDFLSGFHVLFARIQPNGTLSDTDLVSSDPRGQSVTALHAGGLPFCGIVASGSTAVNGLALLVSQSHILNLKPALAPSSRQNAPVAGIIPGIPSTPNSTPSALPLAGGGSLPSGISQATPTAQKMPASINAPAAATPADDAASEAHIAELVRTTGESLIFAEGGDGQGSGFICTLNGKRVLLTNQHVIRGNPAVQFTTLNQATVKAGPARAAAGHDIIAYDIADPLPALEVASDFAQSVSIGDKVVVLGNTEGARVIKPLEGKVIGVGPNLVEISSEFLPGNSGSPIIQVKTGKVIGIATYAIVRDVNSLTGRNESSVRRFGYRLDSVQNWQAVNWQIYQAEAAATKKVGELSGAIINLFLDIRSRQFNPTKHNDPRLQTALRCLENIGRNGTVESDRMQMVKNFLGEIRNVAQRDVNDLKPRLRYDYFQRELADEGKFRSEIYNGLGEAMKKLR